MTFFNKELLEPIYNSFDFKGVDPLDSGDKFQVLQIIAKERPSLIFRIMQEGSFYHSTIQSDSKREWKIVKILTKRDPKNLINNIGQFQALSDEETSEMLKRIYAREGLPQYEKVNCLFNYATNSAMDPSHRFKALQYLMEIDPKRVWFSFHEFSNLDSAHKCALLLHLINKENRACDITYCFDRFGAFKELHKYELIRDLIEVAPNEVCREFERFGNLESDHKYLLLLQLIEKGCASEIIRDFDNFGELSSEQLREIVRLLIDQKPEEVILNFNFFKGLEPNEGLSLFQDLLKKDQDAAKIIINLKKFEFLPAEGLIQSLLELGEKIETRIWRSPGFLTQDQAYSFLKLLLEKYYPNHILEFSALNLSLSQKLFHAIQAWISVDPIKILTNFSIASSLQAHQKEELIYDLWQCYLANENKYNNVFNLNFNRDAALIDELKEFLDLVKQLKKSDRFQNAWIFQQLSLLSQEEYRETSEYRVKILRVIAKDRTIKENVGLRSALTSDVLSDNADLLENLKSLPPKLVTPFLIGRHILDFHKHSTEWKKNIEDAKSFLKEQAHQKILTSTLAAIFNKVSRPSVASALVQKLFFVPLKRPRDAAISRKEWEQKVKSYESAYIDKLHLIRTLVSLNKGEELSSLQELSISNLQILLKGALSNFFGPERYTEAFEKKFQNLVDGTRAGIAFYSLLSILNELNESKKDAALSIYRESIIALMENRFSTWRNTTKHLDKLRALGHKECVDGWLQRKKEKPLVIDNKNYTLVKSDDFSDLMLLGRETGGCLSIDNGINAAYILGAIADGKIQIYAIKNSQGKLIARYLAVLLHDKTNNKPVLLLNDYLSLNGNRNLEKPLLEFVKEDAKESEFKLIALPEGLSLKNRYPSSAFSYSTNGPLEYVDSLFLLYGDEHAKTNGVYAIPADKCHILFDPATVEEENAGDESGHKLRS